MPDIALPAFHITATKKYTVEASHELSQDVERYRTFYRHAYGADVAEADLIREMARRFMESDRDFQAFKNGTKPRSRQRRSNASPATATRDPEPARLHRAVAASDGG